MLVSFGFCAFPYAALAIREPKPILSDYRVRTVMYQPDVVFKYVGHYGYQTAIEFAPGETVDTISMGDSTGWMMNPLANRLFLKPLSPDATTNMTLITNKRTYLFELHAREADDIEDKDLMFIMRFVYPGNGTDGSLQGLTNYLDKVPLVDVELHPEKYNFKYTISGPEGIAPIRIFDDGEFTYFEFRDKNADIPAFFLVDSLGNEALINFRTRGNFIVVERVAPRFTLRHGPDVVCVFNETGGYTLKGTPDRR